MTGLLARARVNGTGARRWVAPAAAAFTLAVTPLAGAQAQRTEFGLQSSLTATDNGGGDPRGLERSDLLFSLRPSMSLLRQGSGLRLRADAGADLLTSARGTRPGRVLPQLALDGQASLVERLVYLEAGANVRQTEVDPLAARVQGGTALNAQTTGTYRIHPYVQSDWPSGLSARAGVEMARTRVAGTQVGDLDTRRGQVRVEFKPRPLGAALEWGGARTDYGDLTVQDFRDDRLTGTLSLNVDGDWILGVVGGRERSELAGITQTENLYGLRALWVPGPRTELAAAVDRRFFGTGGSLAMRHRTPRMSFSVIAQREPVSATSGTGAGLADFLDAILTTRNPDAMQRFAMVRDLAAARGLDGGFMGAAGVSGNYPQLRTGGGLQWLYLGPRTSLSLSVFGQKLVQLQRSGGSFALPPASDDTRQYGLSVGWNRRLDPVTALGASANRSRVSGLGLRDGQQTDETAVRASLLRTLSPRTTLSLGLLVRRVDSDAIGVVAFDETAAFVGLGHRF
jgi:uncharacterized protein (PEP-CTERM system associated)